MKNSLWIFLFAFILTACSQFVPFEDRRREAGQIPTIGRSSDDQPVICYNPLWHNNQEVLELAQKVCDKTKRKAILKQTDYFSCRFVNPTAAHYICQ